MNPTEMTATQLVEAYTTRELSPVETTTAVLDRIDEIDGSLGAYCYLDVMSTTSLDITPRSQDGA